MQILASGFGTLDWTVLVAYLVGIVILGACFSRRQTTTREYFKASGRMSWFPVTLSLIATIFSAVSFLGHPARIFQADAAVTMAYMFLGMASIPLIAFILLPFYRRLDVTSAYEYLESRFSVPVRLLGSGFFIAQRFLWMALVVLAPSLALSVVMGIRVEYCILIVGLMATIYTALGGMSAVIWTDVVQFFILTAGEIMIFAVAAERVPGGYEQIFQTALQDNKIFGSLAFDLSKPTFFIILVNGLILAFGDGVDQLNVQRLMSTKNNSQARKSLLYMLLMNFPRAGIMLLMGISLYAFYKFNPELLPAEVLKNKDTLLPYFVVMEIPVVLKGLVIAALFAAAMSSFDSGLNCLVAVLTVDWYGRIFRKKSDDAQRLRFAQVLTYLLGIGITLGAIGIYWGGLKSIIDMSNKFIGFFFGPMVGVFYLGVFTKRAKTWPTIIGAMMSLATILTIDLVSTHVMNGQRILSIYFYGSTSCILTVVIGYLLSWLPVNPNSPTAGDYTFYGYLRSLKKSN